MAEEFGAADEVPRCVHDLALVGREQVIGLQRDHPNRGASCGCSGLCAPPALNGVDGGGFCREIPLSAVRSAANDTQSHLTVARVRSLARGGTDAPIGG